MGESLLNIVLRLKNEASAALGKLQGELGNVDAQAGKSQGSMNLLGKAIGGLAAGVTIGAIGKMAVDLAQVGIQAEAVTQQFERLVTGDATESMEAMRAAARGTTGDLELMAGATRLLKMGLAKTPEDLGRIIEMSTQLKVPLEDVAMTMSNMSYLRLDTWGISAGAVRARVAELKVEQKDLSTEMAFALATTEQAQKLMGRLGDTTQNSAGNIDRAKTSLENMKTALGEMVVESLEAAGAFDAVARAAQAMEQTMRGNRAMIKTAEDTTAAIRATGAQAGMTAEDSKALEQQVNTLGLKFAWGELTAEQYKQALADLQAQAVSTGGALIAAQAGQSGPSEAPGGAMPAIAQASQMAQVVAGDWSSAYTSMLDSTYAWEDETRTAITNAALASQAAIQQIFASDAVANQLGQLTTAFANNAQAMVTIQQQNAAQLNEIQFQRQVQSVESEAQYQAQRAALVAAGATEEIGKLDEKYATNEAQAAAAYQKQQLLLQRDLLLKQLQQAQAYKQELVMQQRQMIMTLTNMVLKATQAGQISSAEQKMLIDVLKEGQGAQLQSQIDHAVNMNKVAAELASGQIGSAQTAVQGILAAYDQQFGTADAAIAKLQGQMADFETQLLSGIRESAYTAGSQVGGNFAAGVGSAGSTKPIEKAAEEVIRDTAKAMEEAMKATAGIMETLPGLVWTPAMEAGFDEVLKGLGVAVDKLHTFLSNDMTKMLKDIKDYLEPLKAIFGVGTDLEKIKPVKGNFADTVTAYVHQLGLLGSGLANWLNGIHADKAWAETMKQLGAVAGSVKELWGVLTDLSKVVPTKMGNAEWTRNVYTYVNQLGTLGSAIAGWLHGIHADRAWEEALGQLGPAADSIKRIWAVFADLDKIKPLRGNWRQTIRTYIEQMQLAFTDLSTWLGKYSGTGKGDAAQQKAVAYMEKQAAVADQISSIMGIFNLDFSKFTGLGKRFKTDAVAFMDAIAGMLTATMPKIAALREQWGGELELSGGFMEEVANFWESASGIVETIRSLGAGGKPDMGVARSVIRMIADLAGVTMPGQASMAGFANAMNAQGGGPVMFVHTWNIVLDIPQLAATAMTTVTEQTVAGQTSSVNLRLVAAAKV